MNLREIWNWLLGINQTNQADPPEKKQTYPFEQEKGWVPENRYLTGNDNDTVIELLRDRELANPAPFSHRTIINTTYLDSKRYELPPGFVQNPNWQNTTVNMDVPIDRIIGVSNDMHYHNEPLGLTFRKALFLCLHGSGLRQTSLDFLAGDDCKDLEMPHENIRYYDEGKSVGKLEITQYGEWFVVGNGKQRVIFAMFHIWQLGGTHIKNVNVSI